MSASPRLRVAIIGAGIGGLACAIALSKAQDVHVDIYEAAPELRDVGVGIGIGARAWNVLRDMGLEENLKRLHGGGMPGSQVFQYLKSDCGEAVPFGDPELLKETLGRTLHRADLQKVLADHLQASSPDRVRIHFNKRLLFYSEEKISSANVSMLFRDSSVHYCDVLVGGDGVNSAVRKHMLLQRAMATDNQAKRKELLDSMDAVWSGSVCYRGLIPREKLEQTYPDHPVYDDLIMYTGLKKRVIAYQIMHNGQKFINLVGICSWPEKEYTTLDGKTVELRPNEEFLDQFKGWEKSVVDMVSCLDSPLRWTINVVKPLDCFVYGNVALLGDAAHAMLPTLASGGGTAIEDANILGALLASPSITPSTVNHALQVYDLVRRPFANLVAERSRESSRVFEFVDERFADLAVPNPDQAKLHDLAVLTGNNINWAWNTGTPVDKETALQMLEERHVDLFV